jgi:hypothetical protein
LAADQEEAAPGRNGRMFELWNILAVAFLIMIAFQSHCAPDGRGRQQRIPQRRIPQQRVTDVSPHAEC